MLSTPTEPAKVSDMRAVTEHSIARVLLVDDDPRLLMALAETLSTRLPSLAVDTCTSAAKALAKIETTDYDTIVSDVRMPLVSGIELLEKAHALRPDAPVILITGAEPGEVTVRALRLGAYDFIAKPVDPVYLCMAVERAVETRSLRREVEIRRLALEGHAEDLEQTVARRTKDLIEANRLKDEFLATVSHELRTPLTPILGWARLLRAGRLDEKSREQAVESIERNARAQAQLIEDLLDVSRIAITNLGIRREVFEITSCLTAAIDVILPTANAKGVDLRHEIEPGGLGLVFGDAKRLQQVFWNLLGNAVKFTKAGGTVTLAARRVKEEIHVTITDDGCGIHPEFLPFVFDRFRQGKIVESRGGLGLGLTIVRHLVELHEGSVQADSLGINQGSKFTVRLPVGDLSGPQRRRTSSRVDDAPFSQRLVGLHVLVVEDAGDTQRMLTTILANAGARVSVAPDRDTAVGTFAHDPADLVLCDIGLGDCSDAGYEVIRAIRQLPDGLGKSVPAVALTALATAADRAAALDAGFQLHLVKPGPPDLPLILGDLVSRAMTDRRSASDDADRGAAGSDAPSRS